MSEKITSLIALEEELSNLQHVLKELKEKKKRAEEIEQRKREICDGLFKDIEKVAKRNKFNIVAQVYQGSKITVRFSGFPDRKESFKIMNQLRSTLIPALYLYGDLSQVSTPSFYLLIDVNGVKYKRDINIKKFEESLDLALKDYSDNFLPRLVEILDYINNKFNEIGYQKIDEFFV
jgi:hypothetical protein